MKKYYNDKIKMFFNLNQVLYANIERSASKSPFKPLLLLNFLNGDCGQPLINYFNESWDFEPFVKDDFLIAHTSAYVNAVFEGEHPLCASNGIPWSDELVLSVTFTNANLYHSIREAVLHPEHISFSPVSGMHHARPSSGSGFCTFSGQVIASVKLYREMGKSGAWLDLDGHYGNSIEDTRHFVKDLDKAIPPGFNINPNGHGKGYIKSLKSHLRKLTDAILEGKIHYVVWCHGADSHEWDDLGGQVSTEEWIECSKIFYRWVKKMTKLRGKPLPVILTLFGGYRADHYDSVLSLHTADLVCCLNILCGENINYEAIVLPKPTKNKRHYKNG